jgi:hypothetical protein
MTEMDACGTLARVLESVSTAPSPLSAPTLQLDVSDSGLCQTSR